MNKPTSKILIYAVVFLGVLSIANFSTIGYHSYASRNNNSATVAATEGNTNGYNGRYFRDRLKLTRSQMDLFRPVNDEFRSHARSINMELIAQRKLMLEEMQKAMPDTVALITLSESIGSLHKSLKVHTYKYYMGIKDICSEAQQHELDLIFEEFFINDLHMGSKSGQTNGHQGRNKHINN